MFNDIGQGIFAAVFILVVFLSWWGLQYTTLMAYAIVSIILYVMALCYVLGKYSLLHVGSRMATKSVGRGVTVGASS